MTFVLKIALVWAVMSIVVVGLWALVGWLRGRRRVSTGVWIEEVPLDAPILTSLGTTSLREVMEEPGDLESAAREFVEAMATSPTPPIVRVVTTDKDVARGVFRADIVLPPKPHMNGVRYLREDDPEGRSVCPECGRRLPKHRHHCRARRRN